MWDEPVAAVRLASGHYTQVVMTWDDPVGTRVSTYTMKLESSWVVTYHKPKLDRPIRPGLWSVRLEMTHGALLMQTDFMVTPLTHESKEPLLAPQSVNAKRAGAELGEGEKSEKFTSWKRNVFKSGADLEAWVDELVGGYWTVQDTCWTGGGGAGDPGGGAGGECGLSDCAKREWSTLSPDPKSEIGEVQSNGKLR